MTAASTCLGKVAGVVLALVLGAGVARAAPGAEPPVSNVVQVTWFYTEGCHRCREVKAALAAAEAKFAPDIRVARYEITTPTNYQRMVACERRYGVRQPAPMEVFAGRRVLLGADAIMAGLDVAIQDALAEAVCRPVPDTPLIEPAAASPAAQDLGVAAARLTPAVVVGAGLVDGVNPCAFAAIVFLVSVLGVRRHGRLATVLAGLAFAAGVFAAYFVIGLGLLRGVVRLEGFGQASDALYWLIAAAAFALAGLSVRDAWCYQRDGSARRVWLRLGEETTVRVHGWLRWSAGARLLLPACALAGLVVSMLEVVCTGQIYLPTIMVLVQDPTTRAQGVRHLLLYNVAFIVPLLAVLLLAAWGTGVARFTTFSRRSFVTVKLLLAALFLLLAALLAAWRLRG